MLAYLPLTLRQGLRTPATWVLGALGVLATLAASALAVLALADPRADAAAVAAETAQTTAALVVLWVLAALHDADHRSGFVLAADQTRGGLLARFLGRWAGAVVLGVVAAAPTAAVGAALGTDETTWLYLLCTTIAPTALAGAWASLVVAAVRSATVAVLCGLGLWVAGHLPWTPDGWAGPWAAPLLSAWLPGGPTARTFDPGSLAAAFGVLLLALACARPARSSA